MAALRGTLLLLLGAASAPSPADLGTVVVAGGITASCHLGPGNNHSAGNIHGLTTAELYQPGARAWRPSPIGLSICRTLFSAASTGPHAAFTGGESHHSKVLASAELWTLSAGGGVASRPLPPMSRPRMSHASAVLGDGQLWAIAGRQKGLSPRPPPRA